MKEEFNQVKTDWGLFSSDLTSFGDTLKGNKDRIFKVDKKISSKIKASNKDKMATFITTSGNTETALTTMSNDYSAFQKTFVDSTTAFNTWAGKIDTNKTSDKDVKVPLENFKTFLNNSKSKLAQWTNDLKSTSDAAQKDIDDASKIVGSSSSSPKPKNNLKPKKK